MTTNQHQTDENNQMTRRDCGCVAGKYGAELCRYHQAESDAIYQANQRRRYFDPLPRVDVA